MDHKRSPQSSEYDKLFRHIRNGLSSRELYQYRFSQEGGSIPTAN